MPSLTSNLGDVGVPSFAIGQGTAVADTSIPDLFSDLGKQAESAIDLFKGRKEKKVFNAVKERVDALNNESFGNVPQLIAKGERDINKLQNAFKQGKISDTVYNGRLVNITKQLKSKYPNYRDHIDTSIQDITGIQPANALRKSLLKDIAAQQSSAQAQEDRWKQELSVQGNAVALSNVAPDVFTNPDRYSSEEARNLVRSKVLEFKGLEAKFELEGKQLARDEASFNANQKQFGRVANDFAGTIVNSAITSLNETISENFGSENLNSLIRDLSTGKKKLDPDELIELQGIFSSKELEVSNHISQKVSENSNGRIDAKSIKEIVDSAIAPLANIREAVAQGDLSVATVLSRRQKHIKEKNINDLISTEVGKKLNNIAAIEDISPEFAKFVINHPNPGNDPVAIVNDLSEFVSTNGIVSIASGEETFDKARDKIISHDSFSAADVSESVKKLVRNTVTILSDPNANPEALHNIIENTYHPQSTALSHFDSKSQLEVYKRLLSPAIVQNVIKGGSPEQVNTMLQWALAQSKEIGSIQDLSQNINSIQNTKHFMEASVNEKGEIEYFVDQEAFDRWRANATQVQVSLTSGAIEEASEGIDKLNEVNRAISPLITALKGNPQEIISKHISALGSDLNARQDSFLQIVSNVGSNIGLLAGSNKRDFGDPNVSRQTNLESNLVTEDNNPEIFNERNRRIKENGGVSGFNIPIRQFQLDNPDLFGGSDSNKSYKINKTLHPLLGKLNGASSLIDPKALARQKQLLEGEFSVLANSFQKKFGKQLVVNDAIAKSGSSRENKTRGSRHFKGDALDLSIKGLSDNEKLELVKMAKEAGFTGFGFGATILHIDKGRKRGWAYGNRQFGGKDVNSLISIIKT